jgi:hypothetical protein
MSSEPLLRTSLLKLNDEEYLFVITMHHIIGDYWSMGILIRELATLYEAFTANQPSPLPELPIKYTDFILWQQRSYPPDVLESSLAYWKRKLAFAPSLLKLPTDRPRPAKQSLQGAYQFFKLSFNLTSRLKALSRQEGSTLFMTLLAAFYTLLYRYTGQEDILVGSATAGRNHRETENLIGLFADMLVLRADLSDNPTFKELLEQIKVITLEAYTHQNATLTKIIEVAQPERVNSHNLLFQVIFNLVSEVPTLNLADLKFSPTNVDKGTTNVDLFMVIYEVSDGLYGWLEYNTDIFDNSTINRMIGHFETLLQSIVESPESRIAHLPLLIANEHLQVTKNVTLSKDRKKKLLQDIRSTLENVVEKSTTDRGN